eukprot:3567719-Amphidinium_carterae.1
MLTLSSSIHNRFASLYLPCGSSESVSSRKDTCAGTPDKRPHQHTPEPKRMDQGDQQNHCNVMPMCSQNVIGQTLIAAPV